MPFVISVAEQKLTAIFTLHALLHQQIVERFMERHFNQLTTPPSLATPPPPLTKFNQEFLCLVMLDNLGITHIKMTHRLVCKTQRIKAD